MIAPLVDMASIPDGPHRVRGRGVPLVGEATLDVRVIAALPHLARTEVRVALAELPSVVTVLATPEHSPAQLRLVTWSLAALLTEVTQAESLRDSDVSWSPEDGLVLCLPSSAFAAETPDTPLPLSPPRWRRVGWGFAAPPPEPERSTGPLRLARALGQLRAWWTSAAGALRLLALPLALTLAVAPQTIRAPSEARQGGGETRSAKSSDQVIRPLTSACIATPSRQPCDAMTRALWDGDPAAWRATAARAGEPPPTPDEVMERTIRLRLAMGDPQTRIEMAMRAGLPALFLTAAVFAETDGRLDIAVEIANLGAATADLGGARIVDTAGETILVLPAGAALAAGERCRLATTPPVGHTCPFRPADVRRPAGDGPMVLILRDSAGEHLDTLDPSPR